MRFASILMAAVIASAPSAPDAAAQATQGPPAMVSVNGEGAIKAPPDVAHATAGVVTEGKTPREASDANARIMNAVIAAAQEAGIAEADIRTSGFSIFPIHAARNRDGSPPVTGYRASNQVRVTLRDIARIGEVLDRLTTAGANNIAGVHFAASGASKLLDQARTAAFEDARRKAELYAQAAGAQVGRVLSITEQGVSAPQPRASFQAAEAVPPIAPGEETLRVRISVSFELVR